ncbi:MAG: GntR family transcriptional regulator [Deltaproteobacteria bacterium]|nr:GntR family transcriptional regulator [Deltaproteobacteria bacterium]
MATKKSAGTGAAENSREGILRLAFQRPPEDGAPAAEGKDPHNFMINKQSAVPIHVQLKEQVRYAIMSGLLEPGHPLPSIRELTAQLGVHRNTVHRVYLELQAAGILISRPGKGVFVSESLSEVVTAKEMSEVDNLMEDIFRQANLKGVNPITLGRLISQRAPAYDSRYPSVTFVECTSHQSAEYAKELSRQFGVNVTQLLLDDLRADPRLLAPHQVHVVTSLFHLDEVRDLLRKDSRKIHAVTYDLHPVTRKLLRELPTGSRLGFICHDANTEEIVGAEIDELVPPGVLVGCANLETPQKALELIAKVDKVILTEAASTFCAKNCTPDHDLLELHFALNPNSAEKVAKAILLQV